MWGSYLSESTSSLQNGKLGSAQLGWDFSIFSSISSCGETQGQGQQTGLCSPAQSPWPRCRPSPPPTPYLEVPEAVSAFVWAGSPPCREAGEEGCCLGTPAA